MPSNSLLEAFPGMNQEWSLGNLPRAVSKQQEEDTHLTTPPILCAAIRQIRSRCHSELSERAGVRSTCLGIRLSCSRFDLLPQSWELVKNPYGLWVATKPVHIQDIDGIAARCGLLINRLEAKIASLSGRVQIRASNAKVKR